MEIVINSSKLKAKINNFGTELVSLKKIDNGMEYIWQKDPTYWNKSSPVLFPFIGAIKDNQYFYDGKLYEFTAKHGFARDNEFQLLSYSEDYAEFIFTSNESTKKVYPFDFKFYIKYILKDEKLEIRYTVENTDNKTIYFSLGAHPAFNLFDCFIEFEKVEDNIGYFLENSLFNPEKKRKILTENRFHITKDVFKDDVLILTNVNSERVFLKNITNNFSLGFSFKGFKHLALWSKQNAPYICLEPWNGLPDYTNATGKLEEKRECEVLRIGEIYTRAIEIEIF